MDDLGNKVKNLARHTVVGAGLLAVAAGIGKCQEYVSDWQEGRRYDAMRAEVERLEAEQAPHIDSAEHFWKMSQSEDISSDSADVLDGRRQEQWKKAIAYEDSIDNVFREYNEESGLGCTPLSPCPVDSR